MICFPNPGKENTAEAIRIALEAAQTRKLDLVAATTRGGTAVELVKAAQAANFDGQIVIVSHAYRAGGNTMPAETRQWLEAQPNVRVVTAAHALSGAERGISAKFSGIYPVELVAHTLRMLGQGMKVCVEIALMAADCGSVPTDRPVICIGGTGSGADTACVLTPTYSATLMEMKVHELLCKPALL